MRLFLYIIGAIGILIILVTQLPFKGSVESIIKPGLLTTAHAKYENQCSECHFAYSKESQNSLCLKCHEDVIADLDARQGFHGRMAQIAGKQCQSCHSEHQGREFDMGRLDKETFNHQNTDFPLTGAHARLTVQCESCHVPGKKFREAAADCFSCHAKDDRHNGQLGTNCVSCHKETSWKETYFDHSKTRFPLEGKHREATCHACHTNETYKNTPVTCDVCHHIDDIHQSASGTRCEQCHNTQAWDQVTFDHNTATKFILKDPHTDLKCDACHAAQIFKTKIGTECIDCHRLDDVHQGRNGPRCDDCHKGITWKQVAFDHDRDTDFKLLGLHHDVECSACHKASSQDKKLDTACFSCHQADDVHKGQEGSVCSSCHNESGWKNRVKFDHDLTEFPLIGVHAVTACGECHLSPAFKDADKDCNSCHAADDIHKKTLGTDCGQCHNPNGWRLWEFDHNTQTDYKLTGAHEGLKCESCHKSPMGKNVRLSSSCVSCHEDDDAHEGRFGPRCEQCHTVETFKKIITRN